MIWLNVVPHILRYLFADGAKLFKYILSESDQEMLQEGVDELYKWTIE